VQQPLRAPLKKSVLLLAKRERILHIIIANAMIIWYNKLKSSQNDEMSEGIIMAISYKKLWKLLIDRDMKKKDLMAISGVSQSSVTKMGKNENVNTEVLVRICLALHCDIGDIAEIVLPESREA
jgi:DNA-binding Xre family transcriptional regulator